MGQRGQKLLCHEPAAPVAGGRRIGVGGNLVWYMESALCLVNSQCVLWDSSEGSCMVFRSISNYFMPAHVNNYSGTGSQQRAVCSPLEPVQR